jgi:hypothetical protein
MSPLNPVYSLELHLMHSSFHLDVISATARLLRSIAVRGIHASLRSPDVISTSQGLFLPTSLASLPSVPTYKAQEVYLQGASPQTHRIIAVVPNIRPIVRPTPADITINHPYLDVSLLRTHSP